MAKADNAAVLPIAGHEVRISNPQKTYFSREAHVTKLQLVQYYLSVAGTADVGALGGVFERPFVLKRFVNGAHDEPFYQKRAPDNLPSYVRTVTLHFPSGRTADEVVIDNAAALAWAVNLGCVELHPHPVRVADLDHPDELRIDLDPGPGVGWDSVRSVAMVVKAVMDEAGLRAWPKTSGSRGMHVNVRIEPCWGFTEVRRAALAVAREVERRIPEHASSKWWKEERHGVFLDYNQNAKDRTTCSAYSVRPLPDARVSTPLDWDEVLTCDPAAFTVFTVPERFAKIGDPHAAMNRHAGSLEPLLAMAERDESNGIGDAPWPPHFKKMEGEPSRVQPSKARDGSAAKSPGRRSASKRSAAQNKSAGDESLASSVDSTESSAEGNTTEAPKATGRRRSVMPLIVIGQGQVRASTLR